MDAFMSDLAQGSFPAMRRALSTAVRTEKPDNRHGAGKAGQWN